MTSSQSIGDFRLFHQLSTGFALFDTEGELVEANSAFGTITQAANAQDLRFDSLFGRPLRTCGGGDAMIEVGARQYSLLAQPVSPDRWLCQVQDVSAWVSANDEARREAVQDSLTGLHNRACVGPEVARAAADPTRPCALLLIDLDRFKAVNDTLGHPVGDALLIKVADRLRASVRSTDVLARLGGDEFAVLQIGTDQPASAETLAKRLVDVLGRPYVVDGHMVDVGASVGVALAPAAIDGETLFKHADIALYRAKHGGRGRFAFFEPHMDREMQERRALELDLRRALAFRQFELHYQPQLCLSTRIITGMEALLRWRHPERGLVAPDDFIPLAEETGLIVPIGEWVVRQACEDASAWPADTTIAVNVSAKQLGSASWSGPYAMRSPAPVWRRTGWRSRSPKAC